MNLIIFFSDRDSQHQKNRWTWLFFFSDGEHEILCTKFKATTRTLDEVGWLNGMTISSSNEVGWLNGMTISLANMVRCKDYGSTWETESIKNMLVFGTASLAHSNNTVLWQQTMNNDSDIYWTNPNSITFHFNAPNFSCVSRSQKFFMSKFTVCFSFHFFLK